MDYEEKSAKRKTDKDTHSPGPGHPRFSDMFEQPWSGAPVIIHLTSEPKLFLKLGITEKLTKPLRERPDRPDRPSESWDEMDTQRKPQYLTNIMYFKNFHIVCSLAMSKASLRGIIPNVLLPQTQNVEAIGITLKLKNKNSLDIVSLYNPD
jgi:hypothetical protein